MPSKDRTAEMDDFKYGDSVVLVCAMRSVRVGHNLQQANVVIMLEPSYQWHEIIQGFARADRVGQQEDVVRGYLLYSKASSIEEGMIGSIQFGEKADENVFKEKYLEGKTPGTAYRISEEEDEEEDDINTNSQKDKYNTSYV